MGRELLAVRALVEVALAWWDGAKAPDAGEVADRLDAPAEPVRDVLAVLEEAGFLAESGDGRLARRTRSTKSRWRTSAGSSPGPRRARQIEPTAAKLAILLRGRGGGCGRAPVRDDHPGPLPGHAAGKAGPRGTGDRVDGGSVARIPS